MKYLSNSFFLFIATACFAQTIVVQDAITQEVLAQVAIVDKKSGLFVATDTDGVANLNNFSSQAMLSFTHMGYEETFRTKSSLVTNQTIWLTPDRELLEEIILSVSRSTDKKQRLAQQVSVLTEEAINRQNPESTAVLLRQALGFAFNNLKEEEAVLFYADLRLIGFSWLWTALG